MNLASTGELSITLTGASNCLLMSVSHEELTRTRELDKEAEFMNHIYAYMYKCARRVPFQSGQRRPEQVSVLNFSACACVHRLVSQPNCFQNAKLDVRACQDN